MKPNEGKGEIGFERKISLVLFWESGRIGARPIYGQNTPGTAIAHRGLITRTWCMIRLINRNLGIPRDCFGP